MKDNSTSGEIFGFKNAFCVGWKSENNSGYSSDYRLLANAKKEGRRLADMGHMTSVTIFDSNMSVIVTIK